MTEGRGGDGRDGGGRGLYIGLGNLATVYVKVLKGVVVVVVVVSGTY